MIDSLAHLGLMKDKIKFIHQTGEKDYERVLKAYQSQGFEARVEKFIYDMPECYKAASLIICRSGSSTLARLCP